MRHSVLLFCLLAAQAGAASAEEDSQLWTTAAANVYLGGNWRLSQEVIGRFSDTRNGLYEIESNTLLGYKLNKNVTVWAGYTHGPQYSDGDLTAMERRAREQVTVDNFASVGPGKLSARMRFEQRWRDGVEGTGWRTRPYVKYGIPLEKSGTTSLNFTSESFVNLNTTDFQRQKGFDRVRNAVSINRKLNKTVAIDVGYLNQYTAVRDGEDRSDHAATVGFSLSL